MNTQSVRLTERERTVLEMLAAGYDIFDIHESLFPREVCLTESEIDIDTAMKKLGGKTWEHAIALAIRGGHIL